MSADLRINTSLNADRINRLKQLQAQQAAIDAEIAALSSSAPSAASLYPPQYRVQKHQRRSSNVPRSMSSNSASMARHLSSDHVEAPLLRARTISQQSAPSMARVNSKGKSSAHGGNMPFTQTGAMPPPLRSEPKENLAMESWMRDASLSPYTFSHPSAPLPQYNMQRGCELEQVPELDSVGETPFDYITRTMGTPTLSLSPPFPPSTSATPLDQIPTHSFTCPAPSTPASDSLTTATTLASTMSRQSSLVNERMLDDLTMMRVNSNISYSTDVSPLDQNSYDHCAPPFASSHSRCSSSEEQSQLLAGTGASHDSQFSHSFSSSASYAPSSFGEKMEKSQSNESMSSNSSSSRNKQQLQASLAAASRKLMPKGGSDENVMSRANSSQSMSRLDSKDGSQDKVAISKPTYQRPKHERVYCKNCDSHPDGFRGEHELRRHQDREHKVMVKKWICVEPSGPNHPKPETPLAKCKACGVHKKKYGAYYNAAAHLRRTHFKPKAKGNRKNPKGEDGEKRGGKGGGDWPPMSELKHWMKEVEESGYAHDNSQQDDADVSEDEVNDTFEEQQMFQPRTNLISNNFHDAIIADSSPILADQLSPHNGLLGIHNMPIGMHSQQNAYPDLSLFNGKADMFNQPSFHNFSTNVMNDVMVFSDSFPQHVADDFVPEFPYSQ